MDLSGVRVRVLVLVVTYSWAITTVLGQHNTPFFEPDCFIRNCSWSWDSPQAGTQFCERIVYDPRITFCPNPFDYPSTVNDRPHEAEDVVITDVNRYFNSSVNPAGAHEQYTCMNIDYKILQSASDKVKGVQLSIRENEGPDLNTVYCLNLNFSDRGLHYYAVQSKGVFSNQCFCGLKPGRQYLVVVRTMPVDNSPIDPYDTKVSNYHRPDGCSNPNKVDDVRCRKSIEASWSPECIATDQQSKSSHYDIVEVSFDVAPDKYNFDKYKVFIFLYKDGNLNSLEDYATINMITATIVNRTCPTLQEPVAKVLYRFNITKNHYGNPWKDSADGTFIVRVKPFPTDNQCLNAEGTKTSCETTESNQFSLISDPCKVNPCSPAGGAIVGTCIPDEELHSCECIPGYMVWDNTCIVDPCQVLAGSDWVRQCTYGECVYTPTREDFVCNCNDAYVYLREPKVCVADPCTKNPDTNTTVCGTHGQCRQNLTDDEVTHMCTCDQGYSVHTKKCDANVPVGMIIGMTIGSCLIGLLLFLTVFCCFRRYRNDPNKGPNNMVECPPVAGVNPRQNDLVLHTRRVLPIYSDDHPKHKDVVQCFCRLLQTHCKCEVSLLDWQKSVGPTVEMWLTSEIEKADIVLLLCSKGTGLKYKDKARHETPTGSVGVYGDVYVKALTLLDEYFGRNNANEKFVVAYFDYSNENDIPVSFKRFAKYRLMQCMESLFLRIHDRVKDSPHSSRRVHDIDESRYHNLDMGKPLQKAIEAMKELNKTDPKWYQKHNNSKQTSESFSRKPNLSQLPLLTSIAPQTSIDSAYESTDMPRPPDDFFIDTASSGRSSNASNYEESLQQFLSFPQNNGAFRATPEDSHALKMPNYHGNDYTQPETRLFSDDIHLTMNPESDDPFQSGQFYSDIQMGNLEDTNRRAGSFA